MIKQILKLGLASVAVLICAAGGQPPSTSPAGHTTRFDFDTDPVGSIPDGWKAASTGKGALAEWTIVADEDPGAAGRALALVKSTHGQDQTFNLCLTDSVRIGDGRVNVRVKAISGKVDQGGGPMWRVRDANNYYICRANPLESNFRVYKVVNGTRKQLASAAVNVPAGQWMRIEVEHIGNRITCTLNGTTRIEATDDELPEPGGVGVWTKADALTAFDELVVTSAPWVHRFPAGL